MSIPERHQGNKDNSLNNFNYSKDFKINLYKRKSTFKFLCKYPLLKNILNYILKCSTYTYILKFCLLRQISNSKSFHLWFTIVRKPALKTFFTN